MQSTKRIRVEDERFTQDVSHATYANHLLTRVLANKLEFTKTNFSHTIFDGCYFRNCKFVACDFTGCRFLGSQFPGSNFTLCKFEYATFERTLIDEAILESEAPSRENLRSRFARTLRMNYQQLGDATAVNLAMRVELSSTEEHLRKAWSSKESYFRAKYKGARRLSLLAQWIRFKGLDLLWGNGESLVKLGRSIIVALAVIAAYDIWKTKNHADVRAYLEAAVESPEVFFGVLSPQTFSRFVLAAITATRLLGFGLFVSLVTKRFNRR